MLPNPCVHLLHIFVLFVPLVSQLSVRNKFECERGSLWMSRKEITM